MENTNELGLKKYIKLEDGRVFESSKLKDHYNWKDYSDIMLATGDDYYDHWDLDKSKKYAEEIIPSGSPFEADYVKFTEIIATSDYLYTFDMQNDFELDIVIKWSNGKYESLVDFNPDNGIYITESCIPCLLGADEEVFLGSWYEGGMRFVAKWDREKKDWEILYY